MFQIFQKKIYLKDQLQGFIDIHNHILPGIDDGATDINASLELISSLEKIGVKEFIATPHIMNDYYPNDRKTITAAFESLKKRLAGEGSKIRIKMAAEYMMDQAFLDLVEQEEILCLKDNLVLVEMSYLQPPINLSDILFKLQTRQFKPVLAHPERYAYYHSNDLREYKNLKDRGCMFQLNLLSILGHYGKGISSTAHKLLQNKMIDFVGTDAHHKRHLEKITEAKLSKDQLKLLIPVIENTKETFRF